MTQSVQIQQHVADVAAAISTTGVAAYNFTNFLNDTALVVAIISGALAITWHVYRFYQEYRGKRNEGTKSFQRGASTKRGSSAKAVGRDK